MATHERNTYGDDSQPGELDQSAQAMWRDEIDVPRLWDIVEESTANVPGLDHTIDDYQIELVREDDGWFPYYYDPEGRRRMGSDRPHDQPQDAIDTAAEYIQSVRADKRNLAEQDAEAQRVEWPETMGRFHLVPDQHSPKRAVYKLRYLAGYTVLGTKYRTEEVEIRWYSDTEQYHISDGSLKPDYPSFGRKSSAIEAAREIMREKSERCKQIEAKVADKNDLAAHHVPDHVDS